MFVISVFQAPQSLQCGVCLQVVRRDTLLALPCQHSFCKACWEQHCTVLVKDGIGVGELCVFVRLTSSKLVFWKHCFLCAVGFLSGILHHWKKNFGRTLGRVKIFRNVKYVWALLYIVLWGEALIQTKTLAHISCVRVSTRMRFPLLQINGQPLSQNRPMQRLRSRYVSP